MLWMNAFCFSESASARLSENDPLAELRGAEAHVHVLGVFEHDIEMRIAGVAWVSAALSAAPANSFHRVAIQHPVADVDGVDVLLDDDIAGEHAVLHPVAQPEHRGRQIRKIKTQRVAIVMGGAGHDVAQS